MHPEGAESHEDGEARAESCAAGGAEHVGGYEWVAKQALVGGARHRQRRADEHSGEDAWHPDARDDVLDLAVALPAAAERGVPEIAQEFADAHREPAEGERHEHDGDIDDHEEENPQPQTGTMSANSRHGGHTLAVNYAYAD